ncbi:MAG: hypothetical protein FIB02_02905, partial [Desulfuromonas sp.]|nr:hypothetical protein [Desulfuromonas sp.]
MSIRLLSIIGAVVLLGLGGCVVADHNATGYYGGYGYYDPWFYDDFFYDTGPGLFAPLPYHGHRHTFIFNRDYDRDRPHGWSGSSGGIVGKPRGWHDDGWREPMRGEHFSSH